MSQRPCQLGKYCIQRHLKGGHLNCKPYGCLTGKIKEPSLYFAVSSEISEMRLLFLLGCLSQGCYVSKLMQVALMFSLNQVEHQSQLTSQKKQFTDRTTIEKTKDPFPYDN